MHVAIVTNVDVVITEIDTTDKREAVLLALRNHPFREGYYHQMIVEAYEFVQAGKGNNTLKEIGVLVKTLERTNDKRVVAVLDHTEFSDLQLFTVDAEDPYEAMIEGLQYAKCPVLGEILGEWDVTKVSLSQDGYDITTENFELIAADYGWIVTSFE